MKLGRFLFSGYGQTRFGNPNMETCRYTKISTEHSKLGFSCQSHASPNEGDA